MTFKEFRRSMNQLASKSKDSVMDCRHEEGKHIAVFQSGVKVIGNVSSRSVTIRWGSGHQAMATI